jgi:hypothetical protein
LETTIGDLLGLVASTIGIMEDVENQLKTLKLEAAKTSKTQETCDGNKEFSKRSTSAFNEVQCQSKSISTSSRDDQLS